MDRKAFDFSSKQIYRKGNWLNCREVYQLLSYQLRAVMRELQQFFMHSSKKPKLLQHPCKRGWKSGSGFVMMTTQLAEQLFNGALMMMFSSVWKAIWKWCQISTRFICKYSHNTAVKQLSRDPVFNLH